MFYKIKFDNNFLVGTGKPFSMGNDYWANSLFPVPPSVLYGALRSAYIAIKNGDLKGFKEKKYDDLIGNPDSYENASLKIKNIFLSEENNIEKKNKYFFPLPSDIAILKDDNNGDNNYYNDKNNNNNNYHNYDKNNYDKNNYNNKNYINKKNNENESYKKTGIVLQIDKNYGISNYPFEYILTIDKKVESLTGCYLELNDFKKYLLNENNSFNVYLKNYFLTMENKTGIAIDKVRYNVKEPYIYKSNYIRFKDNISLVVEIDFKEQMDIKFVKIGSDNKIGYFDKINNFSYLSEEEKNKIKEKIKKSKKFKIILLNYTIFKNDNEVIDNINNKFNLNLEKSNSHFSPLPLKLIKNLDYNIKPIAVSIKRGINIGGFDMVKRQPKPMYKMVPEGSVYYFEILNNSDQFIDKLFNVIYLNNISDIKSKEGYGTPIIGCF